MAEPDDIAALDVSALQARIGEARRDYRDARDGIVPAVAGLFAHPEAAADALLEVADEFGAEHAVENLRINAAAFGDRIGDADDPIADDAVQSLTETIERVLDARDRLDGLTAERESRRSKAEPAHARVINLDGREFAVSDGALRSIDDPAEAYPTDTLVQTRELTLTEHMRLTTGAEPAQPSRDRTPTRSR